MAKIKYNVCVLTLTYVNRWQFLEKVLKRLLEFEQVTNIIVVNNASTYDVAHKAAEINEEKIKILNNTENIGSAGGYKQAIKYAIENVAVDFLWLLDDDNLPDVNVLDDLIKQWEEIKGENHKKALFCLREDRLAHVKIAKGDSPERYYLVPDNFMGFSILNIAKNQYYKLKDKLNSQRKSYKIRVRIPYVPYGGLFMHKEIIDKIGLPDERFFLYVDDSEYSYRITQNQGSIWLIPSCKVIDIDKSQGIEYQRKPFHAKVLDLWNFRTYYAVRNRIFFYSNVAVKNKTLFKINKALYLGYLQIIGLLSSKTMEFKKFMFAVEDGLKGKLGKADPKKF